MKYPNKNIVQPLRKSRKTMIGFLGIRSIYADKRSGNNKLGIKLMALNMLNKKVDSVFEKTTKDNTRFKAVEPILETIVPRVIVVKFFVQSVFCINITSSDLLYQRCDKLFYRVFE